jgi:hypothetical protein
MVYSKPEIVNVGRSLDVIQGQVKCGPTSDGAHPTNSAYEADE